MQASRLLSVLMLLQAHGRLTAPELARTLEVSERTILRDIDQLSAAGVPVWCERGRHGGFRLRAGWSTKLTGLTEAEVNALFLAGLPGAATELGLGSAAASARLKLMAGLPAECRTQATEVAERLHIDPVDWYRAAETPPCLRESAAAVWAARRIRIDYQSWRARSVREVDPLGLVLKAGTWYLIAQSVGSLRIATYRLANVRALTTTETAFARPSGFNLAHYWAESAARFETGLQRLQARVRLSPLGLDWLDNLRMHALSSPLTQPPPDDRPDWQERLIALESLEHGARQLLPFGAEIEVLDPPELRQLMVRTALAVVRQHQETH